MHNKSFDYHATTSHPAKATYTYPNFVARVVKIPITGSAQQHMEAAPLLPIAIWASEIEIRTQDLVILHG